MNPVIQVDHLQVDYGRGRKKTHAVRDMSFEVKQGECVGFIGPNGAGKSTTIKALMGFLFPTSGSIKIFDAPPGQVSSRLRTGYLPEVALYYPYMKAGELLYLYGGLQGLSRHKLSQRIPEILDLVGLGDKQNVLLKNCSKGMQQRLGIAQAIIADPELLIFDELSSGLDPIGRYDLRNVLLELKARGRTIFFSSHELTEVEDLCDRVLIVHQGRCIEERNTLDLVQPLDKYQVTFVLPESSEQHAEALLAEIGTDEVEKDGCRFKVVLSGANHYAKIFPLIVQAGGQIQEATSQRISLENYFMQLIRSQGANQ